MSEFLLQLSNEICASERAEFVHHVNNLWYSWSRSLVFLTLNIEDATNMLFQAKAWGAERVLIIYGTYQHVGDEVKWLAGERTTLQVPSEKDLHLRYHHLEAFCERAEEPLSSEQCFVRALEEKWYEVEYLLNSFDPDNKALHICLGGLCIQGTQLSASRHVVDNTNSRHFSHFLNLEDKVLCSNTFARLGLPTPKTILLPNKSDSPRIVKEIREQLHTQRVVLSGSRESCAIPDHNSERVFVAGNISSVEQLLDQELQESSVIRAAEFATGPVLNCHAYVRAFSQEHVETSLLSVEESIVLIDTLSNKLVRGGSCGVPQPLLDKRVICEVESAVSKIGQEIFLKHAFQGLFNVDAILAERDEIKLLEINFRPGGRAGCVFSAFALFLEYAHMMCKHDIVTKLLPVLQLKQSHRRFMLPKILLPSSINIFTTNYMRNSHLVYGCYNNKTIKYGLDPYKSDFKAQLSLIAMRPTIEVEILPWGNLQHYVGWMSEVIENINFSLRMFGAHALTSVTVLA
mmetsp:Transcript_17924/g.61095  ORF Transcript_17924/g.61095 Transcript_17924/m.61095 type:complete len:517 (-) Transcript_17924:1966-3516(-)